jgi:hypothetical protein
MGPECAGLMFSRLRLGIRGVVSDETANRVRNAPSINAAEVTSIPSQAEFDVLAGPACAEGYVWWQVNYNGVVGWTVEGADGGYWLSWLRQ